MSRPRRGCVRSVAIGEDLDPPAGEIVVSVTDDADEERFVLDEPSSPTAVAPAADLEFGAVTVEGDAIRAQYEYESSPETGPSPGIGLIAASLVSERFYRC